jgi:hypothetical protein
VNPTMNASETVPVSLAVQAHERCLEAAIAAGRELMALAGALAEELIRAGLQLHGGVWRVNASRRAQQRGLPFPADLVWDVDGMLEVVE